MKSLPPGVDLDALRREGRISEGPSAPTPPCPVSVDSGPVELHLPLNIQEWPYHVDTAHVAAQIVFKGTPLSKQRPRLGKNGNVYTPKETKKYESNLQALFVEAVGKIDPDANSCFALRCRFYRPTRQRIDCDNLIKAVSDAATGVIWKDDSQVLEVIGRLFLVSDNARAEVLIHRIEDTTPKKTCPTCGKLFNTPPSINQIHCSAECAYAASRLELECPVCAIKFTAPESTVRRSLKKNGHVFCSRACSLKYTHSRGVMRPYNKGRRKNKCVDCGQPVSRREYERCRACSMIHRADPTSNYWRLRHA